MEVEPGCNHSRHFPTWRNLVDGTSSSERALGVVPKKHAPKTQSRARIRMFATVERPALGLERRQPVEERQPAQGPWASWYSNPTMEDSEASSKLGGKQAPAHWCLSGNCCGLVGVGWLARERTRVLNHAIRHSLPWSSRRLERV